MRKRPAPMYLSVTLIVLLCFGTLTLAQEYNESLSGEISVYVWGNDVSDDVDREVIAAFNQKFPAIQVNFINSGSNHVDKLLTMIAAGTPPDVALIDAYDYSGFVKRGLATDLTDWAIRDNVRPEAYHPSFWNEMVIDGRLYSIASLRGGRVIVYYNEQFFAEAGLPDPHTQNWNWDQFAEYANLLTRDLDSDGRPDRFGVQAARGFIWPFVWMNGGQLLNDDRTRAPFDAPSNYEAIEWLANLERAEVVGGNMLNGTAAMQIGWDTQAIATFRRQADFPWNITQLPAGPVDQVTTSKGNEVIIPYNAANKELAWEFMKFLGSEEAQYLYGQLGRFFPAQINAARRIIQDAQDADFQPSHLEMLLTLNTRELPLMPGYRDLQNMWNSELVPVWNGESSALEAGIRIGDRSEAILREWRELVQ